MTRMFRRGILPLAAIVVVGGFMACGDGSDGDGTGPITPQPLTAVAKAALDEALQDAYRTYYTYDVVVDDLGAAAPFSTLVATELSFATALADLYRDHQATPPAPAWNSGNVPRFANLQQACMAAEESEVATEMMFERLLRLQLPDDIRQSFTQLRATAREQHRLAFRNCVGGAVAPVTTPVVAAMTEVLQQEYAAFYTYQRIIADLGPVGPFPAIRDAEWIHIGAAANLFVKRDQTPPASTWTADNVPRFASLQAACAGAVDAELALIMLYDELRLQELPADVERVFYNLREASLERHLPAFQQCAGTATPAPAAPVLAAMAEAIQDEYRAHFTYTAVVNDLEPDFPFGPIAGAEESHYTAIANLYTKRGLAVPASTWSLDNVPRYATLTAACAAGVQGEIDNIAMYDRMLALALPADVAQVFTNLRAASLEKHLPAFQKCD